MAKFKIGDKVRIKQDLELGKMYDNIGLLDDMENHLGEFGTICIITSEGNHNLDDVPYIWSGKMLEAVQNEPKTYKAWEIMQMIDEDFESNKGREFKLIEFNKVILKYYYSKGDILSIGESLNGDLGLFSTTIGCFTGQEVFEEVFEEPKYYLKDNFVEQYLNYNTKYKDFKMDDKSQFGDYKVTFTDQEIEDFEIPIERFEKILVED